MSCQFKYDTKNPEVLSFIVSLSESYLPNKEKKRKSIHGIVQGKKMNLMLVLLPYLKLQTLLPQCLVGSHLQGSVLSTFNHLLEVLEHIVG